MKKTWIVTALLFGMAFLLFADEPHAPHSPIDKAIASLVHWNGLTKPEYAELREMITIAKEKQLLQRAVLFKYKTEHVLVLHIGWSVAICHLTQDLRVQSVVSETAKLGFSVQLKDPVSIILHKHPGTDMFYDVPLRLSFKQGSLVLEKGTVRNDGAVGKKQSSSR